MFMSHQCQKSWDPEMIHPCRGGNLLQEVSSLLTACLIRRI